ncbi:sulfate ABC transporter ATP-binding protein [Chromobacterium sp. ATCC 53434]|uniref:sulfate/molybdate ABC transporter ATP-binding protein n=1 Tax=Chromobacterium sp. (strain ATCC 53434 / SC 14030) TaxID=2059672 RepID=UPI000C78BE75|nr:sulfate ABC transporter ATP-binding protein [Chromobacterium sp. ATCC 53434]AUH51706.1 sulfate ABC transporter ATP-binding protein [Chromobacterium sp. ATCC 53434]
MSIQVANIRKAFGGFVALDDVSLNFPGGELVALLGPSGCGKTTLLRIIAGLEQADAGRVLLDGADASATDVRERQVGFVFQHYALFRHMSVFDNVAFGLRMKPRRQRPSEAEIARKVHELLDLVQLDWLADRFPAQLSGGQRQRIALARALAVEPRVLLLDEPFGALDAKVRKELRRWLRKLHDELHITSIFVTHDQEEALEVADRVVLMNHGRVEQIGAPDEVYRSPASAFVYGFLGSANRIRGLSAAGAVAVGGQTLAADHPLPAGQPVEAFVRPHELAIVPAHGDGLPARVQRVLTLGGLSRIELEGMDELAGQLFDAELPAGDPLLAGLAAGQPVRLQARAARVFAADAQGGGA